MDSPSAPGTPISEAEALQRLRQQEDASQRYYAAWWLGRMRSTHPDTVPLLLEALTEALAAANGDPDRLFVARNATRALGKLRAGEALSALQQALDHDDHGLRESAARSLGELGNPAALPRLMARLERPGAADPDGGGLRLQEPCEALIEALGELGARRPDAALVSLLQTFQNHPRPVIRSASARALLQITGDDRWAGPMLELLGAGQLQVRRAALMDLGACGWRPAADALAGCLAENSLKLIALRGLVERPLGHDPAQSVDLGPEERRLLTLMDALL
jgi:phycocyanobilin lyase alpha subunit